jgi:hypothetical protein
VKRYLVVLRQKLDTSPSPRSFRGDATASNPQVRNLRTENLEIPRCAIAHLRFSPDGLPRNDGGHDAVGLDRST